MGKLRTALRGLNGCSPAALRALLSDGPCAARQVIGATLREAEHPTPPPPLRSVGWWDLIRKFSVDESLVLNGASWHDGSTIPIERVLIAQLMLFFKPKTALEVGTYRGDTTRLLVDHLPAGGALYTIDLPPEMGSATVTSMTDAPLIESRSPRQGYSGHPRAADVRQVLGSTFDASTWEQIPGNIEFAFVDASHSYAAVKNDTQWVRRKTARDAVILWHDYISGESPQNGVGRFIREQMKLDNEIFVCAETRLAMRLPARLLAP